MIINLWRASWPIASAGEAMRALLSDGSLWQHAGPLPQAPYAACSGDAEAGRAWIEATAAFLDLQADRAMLTYATMPRLLGEGPAIILVNFEQEPRLLAVAPSKERTIKLITPERKTIGMPVAKLRTAIAGQVEDAFGQSLTPILDGMGLSEPSRERALQSLVVERAGNTPIAEAWLLDAPMSRGLWTHVRRAGLPKKLLGFVSAYGAEYGLWILSWLLVGKWALEGQFDTGWLVGWALLLATLIPLHMLAMWEKARLAIAGAGLVMRTLLEGSFRLRPEEVRYAGVGHLLARVLDSEALQSLAMNGGLLALVAVIELVVSATILATGAKAPSAAVLLAVWMAVTVALAALYHRRRSEWTGVRLNVTHELTERMVGHRTRLAQQPREHWHDGEDESLGHYVAKSRGLDRLNAACMALLPRGWLIVGIAAISPGVVRNSHPPALLAAQLGGILLAYNALQRLSTALATLSGAAVALERAKDVLAAASRPEPPGDPAIAVAAASPSSARLLEIRDVSFRYPRRAADAVKHGFLQVNRGDRILLQGHSGSGKSTWVALTSGVRLPDSGLLFLKGIDRKTLGDRNWRKRIVAVPQFHENHIFAESLAFNLLVGRRWPASADDLAEAETICRELGLGLLLDSMPGGLMQMIGENGWQLSNGEKSRVFLARALLHDADVIVLDETFAALDPETAQRSIDCVARRAGTILCVAHV